MGDQKDPWHPGFSNSYELQLYDANLKSAVITRVKKPTCLLVCGKWTIFKLFNYFYVLLPFHTF